MVLANGQATPRRIQVGTSDDRNTQVVSGLEPGDEVIVGQSVQGAGASGTNRSSGGLLPTGPSGAPKPGGNVGGGGR
jgi:hypothetical protein